MSRLTASRAAFDLIASFEGFRTRAVLALDGQWTLGFGHTATAREGLSVTRTEAEELLRWDLLPIEDTLRQIALSPLSQNQFDALVSFAFNIGIDNFRSSDVLKYLNQGQPVAAALSMHAWRRAAVNGRVLTIDALVRRRAAEVAMFLETTGARPAAPTSIIRPQVDGTLALTSRACDDVKTASLDQAPAAFVPKGQAAQQDSPIIKEPALTMAEDVPQNSRTEGPVVMPAITIPALPALPEYSPASDQIIQPEAREPPVVLAGLSPFPDNPSYASANGTNDIITPPANDVSGTRLHGTPENIEVHDTSHKMAKKVTGNETTGYSILVWALMVLGAALLAFGLYYSWRSGLLTVATPRRDPTTNEIAALLAAASGLIILVTSAVSALNRDHVALENKPLTSS